MGRAATRRLGRTGRGLLVSAMTAVVILQTAYAQPSPVSAVEANPPIEADLPTRTDGPQPAPAVNMRIPSDGATGESEIDPSIKARILPDPVSPPEVATEVVAARTERSRLVANPDGTFTLENSFGRVHYKDATGAWQPIDLDLIAGNVAGYDLHTAANDRVVRFSTADGSQAVAELSADGRSLRLRVPGTGSPTQEVDPRQDVDRLTYPAGLASPGVYVQPTTEGIQFGATWPDAAVDPSVEVVLALDGYAARVAADGSTVELVATAPSAAPTTVPTATPTNHTRTDTRAQRARAVDESVSRAVAFGRASVHRARIAGADRRAVAGTNRSA